MANGFQKYCKFVVSQRLDRVDLNADFCLIDILFKSLGDVMKYMLMVHEIN